MRVLSVGLMLLVVAGCVPAVPDSGAGVGFQDYNSYLRDREAQLATGARSPMGADPAAQAAAPGFSTDRIGAALDAADGRPAPGVAPLPPAGVVIGGQSSLPSGELSAVRPRGNAPAGIRVESGEMQGANAGISDEQDFNAVSARETIESDAQRRVQQQSQYQVIAPTALPTRSGAERPNIVEFAIATRHAPGTQTYTRSSLRLTNPEAACARFGSPDLAQQEFLAAGGPERDRRGLDPDGDGFACGWDPRPFRAALQ